jgi:hypothetical protein
VFNEIFILQLLAFVTLVFFTTTYNILTLWLLGGFYLLILGAWLLLDDGDIFIGFLWVIDLGVGLIFFIFILHYSTFLYQKAKLDKSSREVGFIFISVLFLLTFFYFFSNPVDSFYTGGLNKTWFFLLTWYDYYDFFYTYVVTDLNLLRELYFYNNSFEFFLINFLLFYGILAAILLTFLIKRIFSFTNHDQLLYWVTTLNLNSTYFIRNQNYLKQTATSTGTRVWLKKKHKTL